MKWTSAIFTTLSGKLGGAVATSNRGGNCLRALVIPSNPQTAEQSRIRAIMSSLASYWRNTLSDAQRLAWNGLGTDERTGENIFCGNNALIVQGGGAIQPVAPVSAAAVYTPPAAANVVVDASARTVSIPITLLDPWNDVAGGLNVYLSQGQSPSRFSRQFPYKYAGTVADGQIATPVTFAIPAVADGGPVLTAGQVIYVRLRCFEDAGGIGTDFEARKVIVA